MYETAPELLDHLEPVREYGQYGLLSQHLSSRSLISCPTFLVVYHLLVWCIMATSVSIKWSGKNYEIETAGLETVGSLKRAIESQTAVQPKRQKVLGLKLKGGKTVTDDTAFADLLLKPGQKLTVMG